MLVHLITIFRQIFPCKICSLFRQGIEHFNGANEELQRDMRQHRNRMRSAQRAHEQRAYTRLREIVPTLKVQQRRVSKLETLKHTCAYIQYLKEILDKLQAIKLERDKSQTSKDDLNRIDIEI